MQDYSQGLISIFRSLGSAGFLQANTEIGQKKREKKKIAGDHQDPDTARAMLTKTETRPRTFKKNNNHNKKWCFRQARKVQIPNVEVLHVCRFSSACHLLAQMPLGECADRTQPLQHVFSIYHRMHHCTGLCI